MGGEGGGANPAHWVHFLLQAGEDPAGIEAEGRCREPGRRPLHGSDTLTLPTLRPPLAEGVPCLGPFASSCGFAVFTQQLGGGRGKGRVGHHGHTPLPPPSAPCTLAPGCQDKAPQGQRPTGSTTPNHSGGRSDYEGAKSQRGCLQS